MKLFQKILVANRGEIAVRIIQTAKNLGIRTVAVYAADDAASLHVSLADEAVLLEGVQLGETYLNQEKIIEAAQNAGAQAIHPGYGFLSENAEFAAKVEQAGLVFIGATAEQIGLMGEKTQAIAFVKELEIPVIPGMAGAVDDILTHSKELEFPLLVKASGGGGGKGMEIVYQPEQLPLALEQAQRQALQYFGNDELFVEKFLPKARHIEVQILGDGQGHAVHLFERECSVQRRYQKLIEEAPAQALSQTTKEKLYQSALRIARATKYRGAGTIEFLVDEQENFYFLEMNTRLQVEHPVTEYITGVDLVDWQLKIASGQELSLSQQSLTAQGHAIELRICAEDPLCDFRPASGTVGELVVPELCRWDSFLHSGMPLSSSYDSLIGKLIVGAETREQALSDMQQAVKNLFIERIKTNQEFLLELLSQDDFRQNKICTRWAEERLPESIQRIQNKQLGESALEVLAGYLLHHFYRSSHASNPWNAQGYWRMHSVFNIALEGEWHEVQVHPKGDMILVDWKGASYALKIGQFTGAKLEFQLNEKDIVIFISEEKEQTCLQWEGRQLRLWSNQVLNHVRLNKDAGKTTQVKTNQVVAGLFGKVIDVLVKPGDVLRKGQNLLIIESMKSEFTIQSPADAVVKHIHVTKGHLVQDKELLVDLES
ncbi:biotin carboxylase N-terminal domain-containing protein [uncultured Sunxiuqinia sp.]|uniref:acetyl/propionyl/methylcrotonyl-CoA carboxylase subunit alpha n=1 Tax=uncultured Sunxiuqinia sp. TaxID=1573825 RepID=UPI0026037587|nr:biotin carboxylase N-terminal domain-containing protein [uncultured Sunxiuqinia sp.]